MIEPGDTVGVALSNRVHIFAPPDARNALAQFFAGSLGCQVSDVPVPGKPTPFLLVRFANGAGMTIEFVDDALDMEHARRGAYLELPAHDPEALKQKVLDAGATEVAYTGTPYFYFQAPGGQVFRIVPQSG